MSDRSSLHSVGRWVHRCAVLPLWMALSACGGASPSAGHEGAFPGPAERSKEAIRHTLVASSDPAANFTQVTGLDVGSDGSIYVADWYQQKVTVLDPAGRVVRTIGRRGSGPGEFRSVRGVQVLPGDSLLVYDPNLARISVFAPGSSQPAYVTDLAAKLSGPPPFYARRTRANDAYVVMFRPPFMFGTGQTGAVREDGVRVLGLDGTPQGEPLLTFPSKSFLVAGTSVMPNPFGREGFVSLDSRDRLHFLWNDSARVVTLDRSGQRVGGASVPHQPPRVGERDVEAELSAMNDQVRTMFERTLRDSAPDYWPAARELVVDDMNRIWIALNSGRNGPTEWVAVSPEGRYVGSTRIPSDVTVWAIKDTRIYGVGVDGMDAPAVKVLRLQRPLQ